QNVGTTSAAQALTLSNTGSAALSITSVAVTGTNSGDFAQSNTCGTSVATGASCTISVTFAPAASGTRAAAVAVTDNATGSPQTATLTGTGASTSTGPVVSLSPTSLTFGNQTVGTASAAQAVTLSNTGNATLTISSLTIGGDFAFAGSGTCGSSVAAGASCTISVNFTPTTTGTRAGTVTIADNASNSPQTIGLTRSGVSSSRGSTTDSVSPASLSFGKVRIGHNSGSQPETRT